MFNALFKSWQTTLPGLVGAILFILGQSGVEIMSVNSWGEVVGIIVGMFGVGAASRANGVSSSRAGAE